MIYEVEELPSVESLQLFEKHAFNQNHPMDKDYMELSNRVITYTKGVPLALEVLGSFLLGREKFEWESALEKLESSPHKGIQTMLKISYDGLDVEERELFLDIACFFEGWDKYLVGIFSSHIGISVLIDKALITISYNGKTIRMHDLLQEMGREIVRQESIYKLGQRSRLWHHNDVYSVLQKKMGTDIIRGLCFDMVNIKQMHLTPHAFSEMVNLRFLILNNPTYWYYKVYGFKVQESDFSELSEPRYVHNKVHGFEGLEFDFTELRCLSWDDYPCTSLPLKFCPENLVVLTMQHSNLKQLWTGVKDLAHLKYIDMSYSNHLLKVPDLSEAPNLESLILEGCISLFEITSPSRNLNKLVNLNLSYCRSLINLPIGIQSQSLIDVILSGCSKLNTAPRISCNMQRLCLDGTAIKEFSSSIESPSSLVELNLKDCLRLESLPSSVCNLESLHHLTLSGLSNLMFVLGIPCNIKELYLDGTAIKELSSSIKNASSLVRLTLKDCSSLESLPDGICKLKSLRYLCISGCTKVVRLPEDIGNLESLEELEATGNSEHCLRLESLPSSIRNLNLRVLNLSGLSYLKMVPEFPLKIEELYLDKTAIKELSSSIENASSLVRLSLRDCSNLESLPDDICKLKSLRYLCISDCSKLERLPEDIGNLESLEVLEANGVTIKELPSSMVHLKNLHDLSLESWDSQKRESLQSSILLSLQFLWRLNLNHCSLTELPNNVDQLYLLRDLELEGNNFESVPTNIMNLSKLRFLNIRFCNRLRSLPKLPGSLEELRADGCKLLKALSGLTNLSQRHGGRTLSFSGCFSLNWNALRNILNDAALDMYSDEFEWFKYEKVAGKPQGVMCFPGSKIPGWFNIQSSGSFIFLPQGSFNHKKFLGFVFCAIVEVDDYDSHRLSKYSLNVEYELLVKCLDDYMTFDRKLLSVGRTTFKSDHILLGYNCNTCEVFEFSGDTEAIIKFEPETIEYTRMSAAKSIKKCGVRLLFSQEFEEPMKRLRCSIFDEEEEQEEGYSISEGFKFSNFFKGESSSSSGLHLVQHENEVEEFEEPMKRLRCSISDEEEKQEEAYCVTKGFKSSNFFKGESSSSSRLHLVQHEKELEEFNSSISEINSSANESSSFTTYDLNEFPQDLVGSTRDVIATNMLSPADNDEAKPKGCRCVIL